MQCTMLPLGSTGVKARKKGCIPYGCSPHKFSVCEGRWDRNRTCTLRLWSTGRAVQTRPGMSKLPLDPRLLALDRPAAMESVL
jgi:hypothetical protein